MTQPKPPMTMMQAAGQAAAPSVAPGPDPDVAADAAEGPAFACPNCGKMLTVSMDQDEGTAATPPAGVR